MTFEQLAEAYIGMREENLRLKRELSDLETVINRHSPVNFYGNSQRATLLQMLEYLLDGKKPQ